MKLEFQFTHYTRTFSGKEIVAEAGTLAIELRADDYVDDVMRNVFLRVLRRLAYRDNFTDSPFGHCDFIHVNKEIDDPNPVWKKELGQKGKGDFILITTTFPPEIQKRYEKEWESYGDYLSMPSE